MILGADCPISIPLRESYRSPLGRPFAVRRQSFLLAARRFTVGQGGGTNGENYKRRRAQRRATERMGGMLMGD